MGKKDSIATLFGFAKDYFGISLPETLIKKVEPFLKESIIKKGDILFHMGNRKNVIYFVISGIMRDYYIDSDGNDITRFFITQGSICGGDRLLVDEPSPVCTEALTTCTLLEVSHENFRKLIGENRDLQLLWQKCLESSLIYKIKRENSLLTKNATERYLDFRREYPMLEKTVAQKYIASYLGIIPASLSRIKRTLIDVDI